MDTNLDEIFKLINPANTIGVNRFLAHAVGSAEAVIYSALLAKSAYYKEHGMTSDGWFFSTAADLEESTSFSEKQQRRAIDKLIQAGLIHCERRGMPAKRYFKIGEPSALEKTLALGRQIIEEKFGADKLRTRESSQSRGENSAVNYGSYTSAEPASNAASLCSAEASGQAPTKAPDKLRQNAAIPYKTKDNNQKITKSSGDDEELRENYLSELKRNVGYDELCGERPRDRGTIDEMLEIMLDVICSKEEKLRVNGDIKPRGKITEVYLKLKKEHFLSALNAIRHNPSTVFNRSRYIVTVLYNAVGSAAINPGSGSTAAGPGSGSVPKPARKSSIDTDRLRAAIMARYREGRI